MPTGFSRGTIFLPSAVSSPCMPSRRGTEKPQMSASRRPTTRPRWARATARLTVTDDLPTPPLPDDTARTRAVAGMSVDTARSSWALRRARSMRALRSAASISPMTTSTGADAGEASHPVLDVRFAAGCARGQPATVRATSTVDPAVGCDADAPHHAQIDDVVPELGVDHAQQGGAHRLLGGGEEGAGTPPILPFTWSGTVRMASSVPRRGRFGDGLG